MCVCVYIKQLARGKSLLHSQMLHHSPPPVFTCITSKWRATGWVFKHYWEFGFLPMCEFCAIYSFERRKETSAKATPLSNNSFIHKKSKEKTPFSIQYQFGTCIPHGEYVNSRLGKEKKKTQITKNVVFTLKAAILYIAFNQIRCSFCTYRQLRYSMTT